MFRPQTQSSSGYGRKPISTAPVVLGLESVIAEDEGLVERKLPPGSYSVSPSVAYYKEFAKPVKVTVDKTDFPRKPVSLAQAWLNAEDENRKVAAALRRASPPVSDIDLFKQIYTPKLPSLSDNIASAGDAITAAALATINRADAQTQGGDPAIKRPWWWPATQPPGTDPTTQTPVFIPGTQPQTTDQTTQPPVTRPWWWPATLPPGVVPTPSPPGENEPGAWRPWWWPTPPPPGVVPTPSPPGDNEPGAWRPWWWPTLQPPGVVPTPSPPGENEPGAWRPWWWPNRPPGVVPETQPPVVVPGQSPVVVPGQSPVVVPGAQSSAGQSQLSTVISSGQALSAYFQNNAGTVGPVLLFKGPDEPTTVVSLTGFVGPVTISTRGDEQFFLVPSTNVDPGEAKSWFGPQATSFQGGLAMPMAVPLDAPITVIAESGSIRQSVTIGPALGVNTVIQMKLPDEPIDEKQRLDTLDMAYGHQRKALTVYTAKRPFSTYKELAAAISPQEASSQTPPSYPLFLVNMINQVIFEGAPSVAAWSLIDGPGLAMQGDLNPVYDWLYTTAATSEEAKRTDLYMLVRAVCRVYGFLPGVPSNVCDWVYTETAYALLVEYQRAVLPDATNAGNLPTLSYRYDAANAKAKAEAAFAVLEELGKKIARGAFAKMQTQPSGSSALPSVSDAAVNAAARGAGIVPDPPRTDGAAVNKTLMDNTLTELVAYGMMSYQMGIEIELLAFIESYGAMFFRGPGTQQIRSMLYNRRFGTALRTGLLFTGVAAYSVSLSMFYGYSNMAALGVCIGLIANVLSRLVTTGRMGLLDAQDLQGPDQRMINIVEEAVQNVGVAARDQAVRALVIERQRPADPLRAQNPQERAAMLPRFQLYVDGMNIVTAGNMRRQRALVRDAFRDVLLSFGIPAEAVTRVIFAMKGSSRIFQFYYRLNAGPNVGQLMVFEELRVLLEANERMIAEFITRYLTDAAGAGGDNEASRLFQARRFVSRMNIKNMAPAPKAEWAAMLAVMFGILNPDTVMTMINAIPDPPPLEGDGDDEPGPNTTAPGKPITARTGDGSSPGMFDKPAAAPSPPARVEGSATMTPVATPQFTDAPATMTLEAAMSQLADRTLSVQQVTRSGLPDSYSWYLMKARRRTLRALWFAVFTGLGATPADATQTLNFMDPTFVNVSLNTQEYSGLRIQGRHGSYPKLDEFFLKYFTPISKYFAGLSSAIRVSYASTLATRIFGLRGKSYFTKMMALSSTELAQVAKNSREVLDIVVGDTTYSDGTPQGPPPTTEEARGYGTGPYDYVYP